MRRAPWRKKRCLQRTIARSTIDPADLRDGLTAISKMTKGLLQLKFSCSPAVAFTARGPLPINGEGFGI